MLEDDEDAFYSIYGLISSLRIDPNNEEYNHACAQVLQKVENILKKASVSVYKQLCLPDHKAHASVFQKLLDFLEVKTTDVRKHILQIFILLIKDNDSLEKAITNRKNGMTQMLELFNDGRAEVNQLLLLILSQLTERNKEIQTFCGKDRHARSCLTATYRKISSSL